MPKVNWVSYLGDSGLLLLADEQTIISANPFDEDEEREREEETEMK